MCAPASTTVMPAPIDDFSSATNVASRPVSSSSRT